MADQEDFLYAMTEFGIKRLSWMVFMLMGNDVYRSNPEMRICANFIANMPKCKEYAQDIYLVFGGSSELWKYKPGLAEVYDARVDEVCDYMRKRMECIKGDRVMKGIDIADGIGHVQGSSYTTMTNGFVFLALWASGMLPPKSRL